MKLELQRLDVGIGEEAIAEEEAITEEAAVDADITLDKC